MKYIIVGLGSFGASLAQKLTAQGNEVIGIDININHVEELKEKISHVICMNATDQYTVAGLPLKDTDVVIVAIGKEQGTNIIATAVFKNLKVKRLISRAMNTLHEDVLRAIGVDEIVYPEEESAERWAKKLCLTGVVDSVELGSNYAIIQANVPPQYIGKTIAEINIREKYNLLILTTIKRVKITNFMANSQTVPQVQGVASANLVLAENDVLVLYGSNKDLKNFLQNKK